MSYYCIIETLFETQWAQKSVHYGIRYGLNTDQDVQPGRCYQVDELDV